MNFMLGLFRKTVKPNGIHSLHLKGYSFDFSLDRLAVGVDNFRFDARLSPVFCRSAAEILSQLLARQFQMPALYPKDKPSVWNKAVGELRRLHHEMMLDALHQAKRHNEPQIEYLAQTALLKLVREQLRNRFDLMIGNIKKGLQGYDMGDHHQLSGAIKTKESLNRVLKSKEVILRNTGIEFFNHLTGIRSEELKSARVVIFGPDAVSLDQHFVNPLLHADNSFDDLLLIKEYHVLFGRREEDADKYSSLVALLRQILKDLLRVGQPEVPLESNPNSKTGLPEDEASFDRNVDGLVQNTVNFDLLFNYVHTAEHFRKLKKQKAPRHEMSRAKKQLFDEKNILDYFYRYFKKLKLTERFAGLHEMQSILDEYYPPLHPQQILLYIVTPQTRKTVIRKLKQLGKFYSRPYSIQLLNKTVRRYRRMKEQEKKASMIRFIKGLSRYHCDMHVSTLFKDAMDRVHLVSDEKMINLSRANNTLYEFLLHHEKTQDERPIKNHVILKADVRGSTEITCQMKQKGLNPASYFSLNFFDPISRLLSDYGAVKVFIEGDAVILGIFEQEDVPTGWYAVARACGIAVSILGIIRRYNEIGKKNHFPVLEIGIAICFQDQAPTFLFDGERRIMISPAINLADRLSKSSKKLKDAFFKSKFPFNLCVFQTVLESEPRSISENGYQRYNVNGIELDPAAFDKLAKEINLQSFEVDIPEVQKEKIKIHTGIFPTAGGRYQRLIIREGDVFEIDPATAQMARPTQKTYYEVCTNLNVYQYVKRMSSQQESPSDPART
ncbi:MAG: hypothetical protein V1714_02535 [Pseudomonadota bacterium]